MKIIKKFFYTLLFVIVFLILMQISTQARSYSIEEMNIQATVLDNGDVNIKQSITYDFNDVYNGIYINIPYVIEDKEYDDVIENSKIRDSLYTGSGITINSITDSQDIKYEQASYASNGTSGKYTVSKEAGIENIKVYSPSTNITKTFILDYDITNLCVKHNDIGELYYNFIGGEWDVDINNLNIDVYLPNNKEEIYIWGHGPLNGVSKIIGNTHANFSVDKVRKGQYVAARVLFDKSNIENSNKLSRIDARDMIFSDEKVIAKNQDEKNKFTQRMILFAIVLVIYWIILLLTFEKEKKVEVYELNEEELFKKYNPMLAGCIQGNREILARDIIAIILNLIDKKCINLEITSFTDNKGEQYDCRISPNNENEENMDEIERFVYDWVFANQSDRVELGRRLETLAKDQNANTKFKHLDKLVKSKLNEIGANQPKVPKILRILNVGILIAVIVFVVKHIMFNGFDANLPGLAILQMIAVSSLRLWPLVILLGFIPISLIVTIRHRVNNILQKITGQKSVITAISIILIFAVIIILTAAFSPVKYIIVDEILICIALVIVLTDNLMLQNNDEILANYKKLNLLKDKIEN